MNNRFIYIALMMALLPLIGSLVAGLLGSRIGKNWTHRVAIGFVGMSFLLSCYLFQFFVIKHYLPVENTFYTWATAGMINFDIGFLLDSLSITMCCIVLFISLAVHIYTVGYMTDDPGYQRFFSYVSLFTFSMLMFVLANNFESFHSRNGDVKCRYRKIATCTRALVELKHHSVQRASL